MTRTLLTGATGTLGSELLPRLREAGHDVIAASRSPPTDSGGDDPIGRGSDSELEWVELDLGTGEGIEGAVAAADVIVHAASNATGDSEAVDARGTGRLVAAAEAADVSHLVYPSIVGVDEMTSFSYYEHKLAAEQAIREGDVPWTIVRATQFHEFVDELLGMVARLPIWPWVTRFRVQPIAAAEVAVAISEHADEDPVGYAAELGGSEVRTGRELAEAYRSARGYRRPIVRLPLPGKTAAAFRAGAATTPDRAVGKQPWEAWLAERYD
ncbi:nmra-like family protein [Salinarchaeum sp. Harcht-Bsk1]|uniref:SDR family oxidoreductase n=1 Tax=Salinarchaeum sp. Harcht-Bsk1 TaxID=1333523 RepID=UPI00034230B6|nr:NAD(P)H-binding protein [Salinarchaeum sp. Harcht-Bsk1]AGN02360.1 nmra-like family protein [Salinarchaeum sp. Harcht-Bsk1]